MQCEGFTCEEIAYAGFELEKADEPSEVTKNMKIYEAKIIARDKGADAWYVTNMDETDITVYVNLEVMALLVEKFPREGNRLYELRRDDMHKRFGFGCVLNIMAAVLFVIYLYRSMQTIPYALENGIRDSGFAAMRLENMKLLIPIFLLLIGSYICIGLERKK